MGSKKRKIKVTGLAGMLVAGLAAGSLSAEPVNAANGWEVPLNSTVDVESTVTLTMDASSENGRLNASAAGANPDVAADVVRRTATVGLTNTSGYTVKIRGDSTNLTGASTSNTIPSVTTATTLGQMTNAWGWNGSIGDTATDCSLAGTFKQMMTSDQELGSGGAESSATKKVTMCFGARVDGTKVADTYSNTVTLSVVAQPGKVATFDGITQMQQMTPAICKAADINDTAQLEDVRDGKKYWVTKLLDGNCWMSQNLALDITMNNVKVADSDVVSDWTSESVYPPAVTSNSPTGGREETGTYSWNLGLYVINDPTTTESCSNIVALSNCSERFTIVGSRTASTDPNFYQNNGAKTFTDTEYDAHYLVGNYYFWNAATAGTGGVIQNANATGSICPKGWSLPSSAENVSTVVSGTYAYLLRQYGLVSSYNNGGLTGVSDVNSNSYAVVKSPLFFMRSGDVETSISALQGANYRSQYWSSLAGSNDGGSYYFAINNGNISASYNSYNNRASGRSVRCLVPTT